MTEKTSLQRVAFSPGEFAALFGKSQTWGYRQIYKGSIKPITKHGRMMIPASEVDRILESAGVYNGLKPKVLINGKKSDQWRRFIEDRRKANYADKKSERNPDPGSPNRSTRPVGLTGARNAAFLRLARRTEEGRRS